MDIKHYQGEFGGVNSNQGFQQLEVYLSVYNIQQEQKMLFSHLKLEGHAQTWWKIHMKTLRLEGDSLVTRWEVFKTFIKYEFTLLERKRTNGPIGIAFNRS